ncbi:MAG TPA: RNA-directed DNA polymerase [Chitinophagaceae bacterium]|nr:RNA-directed DNA polymerase [Chitinophagaceae bacterium]
MKRKGNLFAQVCTLENLQQADAIARIGKKHRSDIRAFDRNRDENLLELRDMLLYNEYSTSPYTLKTIRDPKERIICKLPYYPDGIVHHAIMIPLEQILVSSFTTNSYASIKGKGVKAFCDDLERALRDQAGTQYCLKIDVKKFYQNIDHTILKFKLRRKIKDPDLLGLIDEIIDSAPGLPIGNHLSGFFANLYLNGLDHFLKEVVGVQYYFRYMDDIIIPAATKPQLHQLRVIIQEYLATHLKLELKSNYQVFPVSNGIDVVGYVFYHTHRRLRKRTKKRFARSVARNPNSRSIPSYYGLAKHANCNHLLKKLLYDNNKFQGFKHKGKDKRLCRTKDRNGRYNGQGDRSAGFQDRAIQIPGEIRDMPQPPDKIRRLTESCLLFLEGIGRDDSAGSERKISSQNNNREA